MARISTYSIDSNVTVDDMIIGTDAENSDITKNFRVGTLLALIETPTIEEVLQAGNIASTPIVLGGGMSDGSGIGTSGQVLTSTGSGVQWVNQNTIAGAPFTMSTVLSSYSPLAFQSPSGTNSALQVKFGSATSNAYIDLDAYGTITFLTAGVYAINVQGMFGRQSTGGVATVHFRGTMNGVQFGYNQSIQMDKNDHVYPYERSFIYEASQGDTLVFEIMRDSGWVDDGSLLFLANAGGWSDSPCVSIVIQKFVM